MRVCDRCESKPVIETIVKCKTEEEIDLCQKCLDEFEEFRKFVEVGFVGIQFGEKNELDLTVNCHDCKKLILEKDSICFPTGEGEAINLMLCKDCFDKRNKPKVGRPRKDGPN